MGLKKKKWFQTLMAIAPKVAAGLGGPIAGLAMNTLKNALGMPDATDAEIEKTIAEGSPETFLALKDSEHKFEIAMRELDITEESLAYADIASARDREKELKDKMPAVLAVLAWAQWAFIIVVLFFGKDLNILESPEQREILMFVLATTQAIVIGAFAYYHGSSRGSKAKTEAMAKLMDKVG